MIRDTSTALLIELVSFLLVPLLPLVVLFRRPLGVTTSVRFDGEVPVPGARRSGFFNIDIATDSSGTNIVCSTGTTKYTMDAEVTL